MRGVKVSKKPKDCTLPSRKLFGTGVYMDVRTRALSAAYL